MTEIKRKKPLGKPLKITDEQLTKASQISTQDILAAIAFWEGNAEIPELIHAQRKAGKVEE
jgi:hypothetical protein